MSLENPESYIVRASYEGVTREVVLEHGPHLRFGRIQDAICQKFQMMIYEMECTEMMGPSGPIRLGSPEADYCEYYDEWVSKTDSEPTLWVVLPRRRDENGSVIKENPYLENYRRYLVKKDEEEYNAYFDQMVEEEEMRRRLVAPILNLGSFGASSMNNPFGNFLINLSPLNLQTGSVSHLMQSIVESLEIPGEVGVEVEEVEEDDEPPSMGVYISPLLSALFSGIPMTMPPMQDIKVSLTQEEYDQIPCLSYGEVTFEGKCTQCMICGEDYKTDDKVKETACHHILHDECLKPWLLRESKKCPVCRFELGKGHAHLSEDQIDEID